MFSGFLFKLSADRSASSGGHFYGYRMSNANSPLHVEIRPLIQRLIALKTEQRAPTHEVATPLTTREGL